MKYTVVDSDMYNMTLRSAVRGDCWTVLLVKPLVKVTHLAFFKTKSKVKWEK